MTLRRVSFLQGVEGARYQLPAEDHRLNHAGLWIPDTTEGPLGVRSGVIWGAGAPGGVTVVAGGLQVAPFHAVIQGTVNGVQGPYEVTADAAEFVPVTAASATEFRRGRLVARVRDRISGGDVVDEWAIYPEYGQPAATAGAALLPGMPENSVQLREFAVSNTGVITLEGLATPRTGPRHGILPVDAADVVPGAFVGQYRDHPTRWLERWAGAEWAPVVPPPPGRKVTKTSAQALTAGVWVAMTWVDFASSTSGPGMFSSAQPTRLVCTKAGRYRGLFTTIGSERLQVRHHLAGSAGGSASGAMLAASPGSTSANMSAPFDEVNMAVGDFVEAFAFSATALDTATGPGTRNGYTAWFSLTHIGA